MSLPRDLEDLAARIEQARTLPVAPGEIAEAVSELAVLHPHHVRRADSTDGVLGVPRIELVLEPREIERSYAYYSALVGGIVAELAPHGFCLESSRVLEIGCGTGYATFAFAAAGAREAIGIDANPDAYFGTIERRQVQERFLEGRGEGTASIERGDATNLPYDDESFDLVFSASVLEHIGAVSGVLSEIHRVLRTGGFAHHSVDPWFSPQGGHALCTLDFPWGHVRLTPGEFARYAALYRPHETPEMVRAYETDFQSPRATLAKMAAACLDADFEVLRLAESHEAWENHLGHLDAELLRDCAYVYPEVTMLDLLTHGLHLVMRKR